MIVETLISWVSAYRNHNNMTLLASVSSLLEGSGMEERLQEAKDVLALQFQGLALGVFSQGMPWHLLPYLVLFVVLWTVYRVAFHPLNRVMNMEDIGWGCLSSQDGKSLAEKIRRMQKLRKTGDLPPSYPNGWFAIAESRNVAAGQVIPVNALGEALAVFRGTDGEAHVVDAYCPHLGANMAVGGVVKGSSLECPFHGWQFDGIDGSCVHIPNCAKVPKTANVRTWEEPRDERLHLRLARRRGPGADVGNHRNQRDYLHKWTFRGRTSHEVLAHIQEIPENGADVAHLLHLHRPNIFKGSDLRDAFADNQVLDVAQHIWDGEWRSRPEPESHTAELKVTHTFALFGGKFKILTMTVKAEQIGPGVVHLHFDTSLGSGVLIQVVTPVEPLRQKIVHQFYSSSSFIAPYAKFVLLCEARHVERDIMIWNNKQYKAQPMYVKEDRFLKKFRSWYAQFYSQNSQQFSFRNETLSW
ncbi:cholesterol 7-desaturase nvd-like isoform X2 [Macrobrachium nipponense]|uniref:cholesterol 7-desaturase nvd-like isoform X2 n=1 Tax=Macrobrachium nipponense TaxID=159736 RepID=UPI0030C7AFDE